MTFLELTERFLKGGLIGSPFVIITLFFGYSVNDYPLFSFENASVTIGIIMFLIILILFLFIRKKNKERSNS